MFMMQISRIDGLVSYSWMDGMWRINGSLEEFISTVHLIGVSIAGQCNRSVTLSH